MKTIPILIALLASAVTANAPATAANPLNDKAEQKVCKRLPVTGSRMSERVCLTRSEWKKVDQEVRG